MELISGSKIAEEIKSALKLKNQGAGIMPQLAVIIVGDNEESMVYVGLKEKAALSISARTSIKQLPASISKKELLAVIDEANNDAAINGIIIQLPLPEQLIPYQDQLLEAIKTEKDVDGFNPINRGKLIGGQAEFISCAALACMEVIHRYGPQGKNAVLVGDSFDLILPLAIMLAQQDFNVSLINEYQPEWVQKADILVVEKGRAGVVKGSDLRNGMLVIDAGFYWEKGKTLGNVDKDSLLDQPGYLLPVPGGLGPMLIAKLMENLSQAAIKNRSS
ncbi:MAG: bifunctional 5,10-methylenetetrahydrofolate dehydrogenase/5,10-methenyltetrahydrofolate cyclohydrolase [Syntrophomonadaceae bacterium]|jgi:methylenetetrahydrofolate dehydrogenase (NADP+)/methenyltetrahydrofolate cyclohydrolase|nr:bifunctional 5,10-methylenetetrahydrofolate dehydrogenase/5,10-methenyltetrahydrofolate cyclohydrolase [Syntrophomonadaceae bacterium]